MDPLLFPVIVFSAIGIGGFSGWLLLRRGYSPSWLLFAAPLLGVTWLIPWRIGIALVTGYVTALYFAIRSHQRDKEAGGELAEKARLRLSPTFVAKRRKARQPLLSGALVEADTLIIGENEQGFPVRMALASSSGKHVFITGAPGSGKTVTQALLAALRLRAGHGVVVVDPKGDDLLRQTLMYNAQLCGKPFIEWTPDGDTLFNPYLHGEPTEIVDKALAAETYTEPHYLRQAQRYLGWQLKVMRSAGVPTSIKTLAHYLNPFELEELAKQRLSASAQEEVKRYLSSLSKDQRADLGGTRDRLAILAESDIGMKLDPDQPGQMLDLLKAIRAQAAVYIRLDSDRYRLAAQMLGGAIICDLIAIASTLQRSGPVPTLVVIDEFAAIAVDQISNLFARARSAGISLMLGTQTLGDLNAARPDGTGSLIDQVAGNISTAIIHRQPSPDSAEFLAGIAGTHEIWGMTEQTQRFVSARATGNGTRKREREFYAHPDQIKALATGQAFPDLCQLVRNPKLV